MAIEAKDVNRGLRATLWPGLKAHGFVERTERVAWRHGHHNIDVVEVQAVGQDAVAVGCPALSLSVIVATYPPYLEASRLIPSSTPAHGISSRAGHLRPHYWHCEPFRASMTKSLAQPWFRAFSAPADDRRPPSFRLHDDALRKLTSRAVHDVPDIWYMRDDGSNLNENLQDMTTVVLTTGLDLLDQWREPERVIALLETDRLLPPDSPQAFYLKEAIQEYLAGA
jgi:hypothetical protein